MEWTGFERSADPVASVGAQMAELGRDGWELVSVTCQVTIAGPSDAADEMGSTGGLYIAFFKRPLVD